MSWGKINEKHIYSNIYIAITRRRPGQERARDWAWTKFQRKTIILRDFLPHLDIQLQHALQKPSWHKYMILLQTSCLESLTVENNRSFQYLHS